MKLEILSEQPAGPAKPVRLLFVHGICVGAWAWARHFLKHFAALGYESHAVSLRGHGHSPGREIVARATLKDFADDLASAAARIGGPVALVGHSMGGGVAQNYLRLGGKVAGLALMASAPPHGLARASMMMFWRDPGLWRELNRINRSGFGEANYDILERGLFSGDLTEDERRPLRPLFSPPAVAASIELAGWRPIAPAPWAAPPVCVIGGGRDALIPQSDVMLTGAYYGVRPVILPRAGHVLMLGESWRAAAAALEDWLHSLVA